MQPAAVSISPNNGSDELGLTRLQRWFLASVVAVLFIFLVLHYMIIVLYNSRPNPLKVRHATLISRYVNPLFTQDWHLFSPDPINMDVILLMKTRHRPRPSAPVSESDWIDITTPILTRLHENRLSSLGSLAHIHVYALLGRAPAPAFKEMLDLMCRDADAPACRDARQRVARRGALADRLAARIASAHARKLYGSDADIVETKIRLLVRRVPRFSQRHKSQPHAALMMLPESPWRPYERVAVFH